LKFFIVGSNPTSFKKKNFLLYTIIKKFYKAKLSIFDDLLLVYYIRSNFF
jgi:hypothetical protein